MLGPFWASLGLTWAASGHFEPSQEHLGTKSFQVSCGGLGPCPGLAILGRFGVHLGNCFGTRLAKEGPRWAQEDHQEVQNTENILFFKVFGGPRPSEAVQDSL